MTKYHVLFSVSDEQTNPQGEIMHYTQEQMSSESREMSKIAAEKGLVTQIDGGYLTDLGRSAAEHAQALILILAPHKESVAS